MRRKLILILPGAGVLLLLLPLLGRDREGADTPAPSSRRLDRFERGLRPALPLRLRLSFRPGDLLTYRFEQDHHMSMGRGNAGRAAIRLAGLLEVAVYTRREDTYTIGYRFREASFTVDAGGEAGRTAIPPIEALARVTIRGGLGAVHFPADLEVQSRMSLLALLQSLHFSFPPDARQEWGREEEDTTGRYRAAYTLEGIWEKKGRPCLRLRRRKERYLRANTAGPEILPKVRGSTVAHLDLATAQVRTVEGQESIELRGTGPEGHNVTMDTSVRFEFEKGGFSPDLAAGGDPLPREGYSPLSPGRWRELAETQRDIELARRRDRVQRRGLTLEGILARFEARGDLTADPEANWELLQDAIALFAVQPEAIEEALDRILAGGLSLETIRALESALGSSQSPDARRGLERLLQDASLEAGVRQGAVLGLALCRIPTEETHRTVRAAVDDPDREVAETSLLVLGILASRGEGSSSVSFLVDRLKGSDDPRSQRLALEALGNTADPAALSAIESFARREEEHLRAGAIHALRGIPGERAESLLRTAAREDVSEHVRTASVRALAERGGETAAPALEDIAAKDPRPSVRSAALVYFSKRAGTDGRAREVLRRVSRSDPSPDIREQASQILRRLHD